MNWTNPWGHSWMELERRSVNCSNVLLGVWDTCWCKRLVSEMISLRKHLNICLWMFPAWIQTLGSFLYNWNLISICRGSSTVRHCFLCAVWSLLLQVVTIFHKSRQPTCRIFHTICLTFHYLQLHRDVPIPPCRYTTPENYVKLTWNPTIGTS